MTMENNLITKNSELVASVISRLDDLDRRIGSFVANSRPVLDGEQYLTDQELSEALKISRFTLQEYRTNGRIPYLSFAERGGKIIYRASDINKLLRENYRSLLT